MRYIITGGTGHIGNNLIRYISKVQPEAEVVALLRRENPKELIGANCKQVVGKLTKEFLEENIQENDVVIHLAGYIDLANKNKEQCYNINFLLAKEITDICLSKNVKKYIYVGSVDGIYREGDGVITEPEEYFPEKIEGNYGQTKAMAGKYVLEKIRQNPSFNCAIVLPTAVIGLNDYKPSAVGKIVLDVLCGKAEFGIKGGYNFVDVEDVAKAIYDIANCDAKGQYIISGHNVSVEELYHAINKYKGFKKKPIIFPTWVAHLACPFVKVLSKITIKALGEPHNYSSQRAEKDFGYKARNFEDTLKNTIDWLEENKEILLKK